MQICPSPLHTLARQRETKSEALSNLSAVSAVYLVLVHPFDTSPPFPSLSQGTLVDSTPSREEEALSQH